MKPSWPLIKLSDVVNTISGGTPSKSNPDFWIGSIPWISAKDMKKQRIYDSEDHISDDGLKNGSKLAPRDATLILVRGMTLLTDIPICSIEKDCAFNQDIKAIIPKQGLDSRFLTYLLLYKKPELLGMVDLAGHGTGRLPTDLLMNTLIPFPGLSEQRAISAVLSALDDKIELNRQMNNTLEEMAQAIFTEWFVHFDPFRDGGMQDSELGPIPAGWRVGKLNDLFVLQRGFDLPASQRTDGYYKVISAGGLHGYHNEYKVKGPGVVTGRSGVIGKVFYVTEDYWPLNTTLWIKQYFNSTPLHAYQFLKSLDFTVFAAGSAVPTLNRNHIHTMPVVIPSQEALEKYNAVAVPLIEKLNHNEAETQTLSSIRDALLPKLMSGEIRVPVEAKQS